ncbi:MAG: hypothetical protein WBR26_09390 [Candidatus Acidiferrum sp.]
MQRNARERSKWWVKGAVVAALPVLAFGLAGQQITSLVINGLQGSARVAQVGGHNYVDIEGLARVTNGTISFQNNQIVLAIPGMQASAGAAQQGLSNEFLTAAIEAMARVREWHAALRTAIEKSVPIADGWLSAYQAQAQQSLGLASVAISTDADRKAYPLMVNEFNNMKTLNDKYVAMAKSMDYVDPTSLQSDPLNQKMVSCGRALTAMAATKQFSDDPSCQ